MTMDDVNDDDTDDGDGDTLDDIYSSKWVCLQIAVKHGSKIYYNNFKNNDIHTLTHSARS